ncbi:2-phospho-L-lactate guanylyltransferase [Salinarchaeum laminariae]|uniref:2-phospho-L-lactate guanylyltransferase n=1 Tax=Salinarchaeum laminariae TaxID=869888 RepID=UPI0020C0C9C4|nr:2-phospho-L-lactate guanylyltransferase [Salinarchaeum laminariae]
MDVAVPFDAVDPKSRLSGVFDADERTSFARVLLVDVLDAVRATGHEPTVYATGPAEVDAEVVVDERGLDSLCNSLLDDPPVAVVMADLGLATPAALERLFDAEGEVVAVPGLGGGTNALVVRDDTFSTDYHGVSVRDHRQIASDAALEWTEIDSLRLGVDVDERADLVEVLLHGDGEAPDWLRAHGFAVAVRDGRATVVRES